VWLCFTSCAGNLSILKKIKKLYEKLPDVTLLFTSRIGVHDRITDKILEEFHDVNIVIRQEFSDLYLVTAEDSIVEIPSYRMF